MVKWITSHWLVRNPSLHPLNRADERSRVSIALTYFKSHSHKIEQNPLFSSAYAKSTIMHYSVLKCKSPTIRLYDYVCKSEFFIGEAIIRQRETKRLKSQNSCSNVRFFTCYFIFVWLKMLIGYSFVFSIYVRKPASQAIPNLIFHSNMNLLLFMITFKMYWRNLTDFVCTIIIFYKTSSRRFRNFIWASWFPMFFSWKLAATTKRHLLRFLHICLNKYLWSNST